MIKIKDIPYGLRPREKAEKNGIESLSDAELLAIIISSGVKGKSALDIAYALLNRFGSIEGLANVSYNVLKEFSGIKTAKAIRLIASFELIHRYERICIDERTAFLDLESVIKFVLPKCFDKKTERLYLLLLDNKYRYIRLEQLYQGTKSSLVTSPKEIVEAILRSKASRVYLIHNHPSNNVLASEKDFQSTNSLICLLATFSIELIDSIIIGLDSAYSILERKVFKVKRITER